MDYCAECGNNDALQEKECRAATLVLSCPTCQYAQQPSQLDYHADYE